MSANETRGVVQHRRFGIALADGWQRLVVNVALDERERLFSEGRNLTYTSLDRLADNAIEALFVAERALDAEQERDAAWKVEN